MVNIQKTSAKMATPGLLKIRIFGNKGYDVMISVHDVNNKFLLCIQTILQMWSCDLKLVTVAFV